MIDDDYVLGRVRAEDYGLRKGGEIATTTQADLFHLA